MLIFHFNLRNDALKKILECNIISELTKYFFFVKIFRKRICLMLIFHLNLRNGALKNILGM